MTTNAPTVIGGAALPGLESQSRVDFLAGTDSQSDTDSAGPGLAGGAVTLADSTLAVDGSTGAEDARAGEPDDDAPMSGTATVDDVVAGVRQPASSDGTERRLLPVPDSAANSDDAALGPMPSAAAVPARGANRVMHDTTSADVASPADGSRPVAKSALAANPPTTPAPHRPVGQPLTAFSAGLIALGAGIASAADTGPHGLDLLDPTGQVLAAPLIAAPVTVQHTVISVLGTGSTPGSATVPSSDDAAAGGAASDDASPATAAPGAIASVPVAVADNAVAVLGRTGDTLEPHQVNGEPGAIIRDGKGNVFSTLALDVAGGRIQTIRSVINPDKLAHLGPVADADAFVHAANQARRKTSAMGGDPDAGGPGSFAGGLGHDKR